MAEQPDSGSSGPDGELPFVVRGYHGTNGAAAETALCAGFVPTRSEAPWLGQGVYFFESDPQQAIRWAERWHQTDPAVLEVSLVLDSPGLDLLGFEARWLFRELATEMLREDPDAFDGLDYCDGAVIEFIKVVHEIRWVRALVLVGDKEYASGSGDDYRLKTITLPDDARVRTIRNAVVVVSVCDSTVIDSTRRYHVAPD